MIAQILTSLLLLSGVTQTGTECYYLEFPDHFEAVCVGDERYEQLAAAAKAQQPSPDQELSGRGTDDGSPGGAPPGYSAATGSAAPAKGMKPSQATSSPQPVQATNSGSSSQSVPSAVPVKQRPSVREWDRTMPSMYRAPRSLLGNTRQQ